MSMISEIVTARVVIWTRADSRKRTRAFPLGDNCEFIFWNKNMAENRQKDSRKTRAKPAHPVGMSLQGCSHASKRPAQKLGLCGNGPKNVYSLQRELYLGLAQTRANVAPGVWRGCVGCIMPPL